MKNLLSQLPKPRLSTQAILIGICLLLYDYMALWIIYIMCHGFDPFHAFWGYIIFDFGQSYPIAGAISALALILLTVAKKPADRIVAILLGIFPFSVWCLHTFVIG